MATHPHLCRRPLNLEQFTQSVVKTLLTQPDAERFADAALADISQVASRHAEHAAGRPLHEAAAMLAVDLVQADPGWAVESRVLLPPLLDVLAGLNGALIDWDADADQFDDLIDGVCAGDRLAAEDISAYLASVIYPVNDDTDWEAPEEQTRQVRVFILGPMTGLHPAVSRKVREVARRISACLRARGFDVHAPCAEPTLERPEWVVVEDDLDHMARADLVIVLATPPAAGVGMLLGYSDRYRPLVLVLGSHGSYLTPIAADLEDRREVVAFEGAAEAVAATVEFVNRRAADLEDHARAMEARRARFREQHEWTSLIFRALTADEASSPTALTSPRVRRLCLSLDHFIAASLWESQEITSVIRELSPSAALEPVPQAAEWDEHAADHGAYAEFEQEPQVPRPWTVDVGAPRSQLALFDDDALVRPAVPRPVRPRGWEDQPLLTLNESLACDDACDDMLLASPQRRALKTLGAGVRCDEQLLAAVTRSRMPLSTRADWHRLWQDRGGES